MNYTEEIEKLEKLKVQIQQEANVQLNYALGKIDGRIELLKEQSQAEKDKPKDN